MALLRFVRPSRTTVRILAFAAILLAIASVVAVPSQTVHGGVPTQTPTPTSTATPSVDLVAPTDVRYSGAENRVTWTDNATGEEGYRLIVTFGIETRSFEVGPDAEELQLPDDFRSDCPVRPNVEISVTAFAGAAESEPGSFVLPGLCAPATITPAATATPEPTPGLPDTGSGGQTGAPGSVGLAALLALLVGAGVLLVASTLLGSRPHG